MRISQAGRIDGDQDVGGAVGAFILDAFQKFVNSGYEFGGQATLAAQMRGQGAALAGAASVSPGVWVYQLTDEGLAAELTVKGTKYYRDKELNAAQP